MWQIVYSHAGYTRLYHTFSSASAAKINYFIANHKKIYYIRELLEKNREIKDDE